MESISFGVHNPVLTARTEGEIIALLIFVASQIKMSIFSGKKKKKRLEEKSKAVGNPPPTSFGPIRRKSFGQLRNQPKHTCHCASV